MNIKDFQAVLDVYDSESFSEAAFNSNFSTSAISKQVARLEKELNVQIFERKTKGHDMALTKAGELLLPEFRKLIDIYSNIEYIASGSSEKDSGILNVGYVPLIGTIGETEILSRFAAEHSDIHLNLFGLERNELARMLAAGKLDACFVLMFSAVPGNYRFFEFLTNENIRVISLVKREKLYVGMSKNHKFATRESVRLEELKDDVLIFSNLQDPNKYETRIGKLQKILAGDDNHLKTRFMDFSNRDMVLNVVETGKAILPQVVEPLTHGHEIVYVPVANWPDQVNGLFIYRRDCVTQSLRNLIKCAKDYAEEHSNL